MVVSSIIKDLLVVLNDVLQDDRYAIPILELLAFLLDAYVPSIPEGLEPRSVLSPPYLVNY